MSIFQRFFQFNNNLSLTQNQYNDAKTKYDSVCKTLHNYYYSSSYDGSTKYLVGSYGKQTSIRPPGDVDVIFKIPFDTYQRFNNNTTGPRGLLNEIRDILRNTFTTTSKIKPNGMVVEVAFTSYNIEVLPAFEWTTSTLNGKFQVPTTSNPSSIYNTRSLVQAVNQHYGSWKTIDPREEILQLNNSNVNHRQNTKRLVRMMKCWLRHCNVPIKPVAIERLIREFLWGSPHHDKSFIYYDYLIRDFLSFLISKRNTTIFMPTTNDNVYLGDAWFTKAGTAYARAKLACEHEAKKEDFSAAYEWKKIFGDLYPY